MRVLITGAGGQLGLDLLDAYSDHDVVGTTRDDLDVSDESAVVAAVADLHPDLVVNAAAWTDVDGCEKDEGRAHAVNALGPRWIARACARIGATMVQISTDYVFSGEPPAGQDGRPRGWTEHDDVIPANAYGRSKAAGERSVRASLAQHHIIRTAWVNSARGNNFVRTMLRLSEERDEVHVVDDQFGSPTFTRDLAAAVREVAVSGRFGTVHRTNSGYCSWFELAAATFALAGVKASLIRTSSDRLTRPASRPAWSVLDDGYARTCGLSPLPHWRDGLRRLLDELGADSQTRDDPRGVNQGLHGARSPRTSAGPAAR